MGAFSCGNKSWVYCSSSHSSKMLAGGYGAGGWCGKLESPSNMLLEQSGNVLPPSAAHAHASHTPPGLAGRDACPRGRAAAFCLEAVLLGSGGLQRTSVPPQQPAAPHAPPGCATAGGC